MPLEDKQIARRILREIYKLPLDPALININVINQVCYIGGRLRRSRAPESRGLDMRKLVADLEEMIRRFPGVRDVMIDAVIED